MSEVTPTAPVEGTTPPVSVASAPVVPGNDRAADLAAPAPAVTPPAEPPKPADAKDTAPPAFDATKLTLPEGLTADDPHFKSFSEVLADGTLDPQARGQKLLDIYKEVQKASSEAGKTAWDNLQTKWQSDVKADPEIGGAKFESTKATIARAIDTLGPTEATAFRQALDLTGAGNNPAIIKGLAKLAAALTEGGHVQGQPPAGSTKPSVKEAFYPNSPDMK